MNIIIPIGGVGKRFSSDNYNLPKPLVRTLGEHLIVKCIDSLNIDESDTLYIIYRQELQKFNFESVLRHKFPLISFKFLCINFDTRGASETVLQCLVNINQDELKDLTIVIDSDNLYKEDVIGISKRYNDNLIFYHESIEEKPIFSYIEIKDNKVIEIKEKVKITNNACVGAYCFRDANLLKNTIIDIIKDNDKTLNEFYISNIYKKLLQLDISVFSYKINEYICLGTPEQLKINSSNLTKSNKKFRFCFDFDNTLVTYPSIKGDYTSVKPIDRNINYLKFLYNQGHEIIIYTARRMKTHFGNVGKLQADIGRITFDTLDKFEIPYHEIYFGKPYADFYIDDLAIKPFDDLEKETGFYNIHPDTRVHNKIEIFDDYIIKYSSNIEGEKYWYENIPHSIINYFPNLLSSDQNSITLSKIKAIPLSYLNINKTLTKELIIKILNTIDKIHSSEESFSMDIYSNYYNKLIHRVSSYNFTSYDNFNEIYSGIKDFLIHYESNNLGKIGVIHGDPVFTNILLDHNNNLFFIDMRGKIGDEFTIYGDIFYDYAKIYQSIIGYDHILMDKEIDENYINENKSFFEEFIINKYGIEYLEYVQKITISLILSLIPIHNNSKCKLFYKLINKII